MTLEIATAVIVWDTLNVVASCVIFAVLSWTLALKLDDYTPPERIGMGIIAAGCIMRVGPIATKPSPFDDWATFWMAIGMIVYFIGRHFRHTYANWLASRQAARILRAKGLLK